MILLTSSWDAEMPQHAFWFLHHHILESPSQVAVNLNRVNLNTSSTRLQPRAVCKMNDAQTRKFMGSGR